MDVKAADVLPRPQRAGATTQHGVPTKQPAETHVTGPMTNRGLVQFAHATLLGGLSLTDLFATTLSRASAPSAVELGCGEGRALLELQSMYPNATNITCINSLEYARRNANRRGLLGNGLVAGDVSEESYRSTAASFNIPPLHIWPRVLYGDYMHERPLPFESSTVDLVYSQAALNQGKVTVPKKEVPYLMQDVARVLRPDGVAALQLTQLSVQEQVRLLHNYSATGQSEAVIRKMMHSSSRNWWRPIGAALRGSSQSLAAAEVLPLDFAQAYIDTSECVDVFLFLTNRTGNSSNLLELTAGMQSELNPSLDQQYLRHHFFETTNVVNAVLHKHRSCAADADMITCANPKKWQELTCSNPRPDEWQDLVCNYDYITRLKGSQRVAHPPSFAVGYVAVVLDFLSALGPSGCGTGKVTTPARAQAAAAAAAHHH